jgi:hypothetical protein
MKAARTFLLLAGFVALTTASPSGAFDVAMWKKFIELNRPAAPGPANRGKADPSRPLGDTAGPRVWMTWKSRFEIFQPGGGAPAPWASYDGRNPCGAAARNDAVTLNSFSAFSDFNQALDSAGKLGNPLVAQNRTYVRYEIRVNREEFDTIVGNGWYRADKLPGPDTAVPYKVQSTGVKAAWRILTDRDTPQVRSRYYVVPDAQVFDVEAGRCVPRDVALVGLHIVTKTPGQPQWIWSSFEHVDNVPGRADEPTPPAGVPLSFNDPARPQALDPSTPPLAVSPANPPRPNPAPMQVIRKQKIAEATRRANKGFWDLPEVKGTVWQNYMLVATQWPSKPAPESPANDGAPFPTRGVNLGNTTMETYFQDDGASCMACHQLSNKAGRGFVMFVTMDAWRPGAARNGPPLAGDPLMKSLIGVFDAKRPR